MDSLETPEDVLAFWFSLELPDTKDDEAVRARLGPAFEHAAAGDLDGWVDSPRERLALVLLLDQVPRHLYRRDARAFAMDLKAQEIARRFFEQRDWHTLSPAEKAYAVRPYLHAEDLAKQEEVYPVLHELSAMKPEFAFMAKIADLYIETIRTFRYFPHRNAMRGRQSTAEEERFLREVWHPRRAIIVQGAF